jgi:hypothetical protein
MHVTDAYRLCVTSFPFLNSTALFIVFAVGADDIFVAVDKWRAMRRELPHDFSTEQVAAHALPKIAFATFVTSITTAAAFFASAGVKAPIVASFSMDYVLSIIILFPAICMHDRWLAQGCRSRWLSLSSTKRWGPFSAPKPEVDEENHVCGESAANVEDAEKIGKLQHHAAACPCLTFLLVVEFLIPCTCAECLVSDECNMIEAIEVTDNSCQEECFSYPVEELAGTAAKVKHSPFKVLQQRTLMLMLMAVITASSSFHRTTICSISSVGPFFSLR